MSVYTSPALVITPDFEYAPHHPLVLWETLVTRTNVAADSAEVAYPASNLANPNTNLRWQSASTASQQITISDLDGEIDCLAIARHNFGSGAIEVTEIEGITADLGAVWESIFGPQQLADDTPAMFRFAKDFYVGIRITLTPDATAPQCAVLFCGELMAIKPGISPGYIPLSRALQIDLFNGRAERGEYLGSIVDGATLSSRATVPSIDPDYYDEVLKPFVYAANRGSPFFFAWAPEHHADEVAYAWLNSPANPSVTQASGELELSLDMSGLAL